MEPAPPLPGHEELHREAVGQVIRKIMRVRVFFVPLVALFLSLIVILDQPGWTVPFLGLVLAMQLASVIFDALRLRRRQAYATRDIPLDLMINIVLQTGVIWLTGAIESPLIVIYVPMGLVAGIALGGQRGRWLLVVTIAAFIAAMVACGLLGWIPRTLPAFLDLEPGFYDRPVYALTKAAILAATVGLASQVGKVIYGAITRMFDEAIGARQQALETLADRNRELVYLGSAIAHELKNPLASIHGLVQLLDRGTGERSAARLDVLRREVDRMRGTLDAFLNFSRPLGELTRKELDVTALCARLSALHEGLARSRALALRPPEGPPLTVIADGRKLEQALVNLLQNALEATPPGGLVRWVARREGDDALLGVADSGPGMPEELLGAVGAAGATTKPQGSGIGLAIARAIAEQHGGRLAARNLPGGGCEVLLRLPAWPPAAPSPGAAGAAPREAPREVHQ